MFIDFAERGVEREGERERDVREKHLSVASCTHPDRDQACNLGMCLDQGSNGQRFGV